MLEGRTDPSKPFITKHGAMGFGVFPDEFQSCFGSFFFFNYVVILPSGMVIFILCHYILEMYNLVGFFFIILQGVKLRDFLSLERYFEFGKFFFFLFLFFKSFILFYFLLILYTNHRSGSHPSSCSPLPPPNPAPRPIPQPLLQKGKSSREGTAKPGTFI